MWLNKASGELGGLGKESQKTNGRWDRRVMEGDGWRGGLEE
jgi:hypothetical protein